MQVKLTIWGDPMGKQRPKATAIGTHARVYTPKETIQYESKVVGAYKDQVGNFIAFPEPDTEVWATIIAYFQLQKSHYGKKGVNQHGLDKLNGKVNPTKKPDLDNIAKLCLDGLNGLAYYDDSQITNLFISKRYSETPRVEITLESKVKL